MNILVGYIIGYFDYYVIDYFNSYVICKFPSYKNNSLNTTYSLLLLSL